MVSQWNGDALVQFSTKASTRQSLLVTCLQYDLPMSNNKNIDIINNLCE